MKRIAFVICALSSLFFAASLGAQVDTTWVSYFGEGGWDYAEEVQPSSDGGYIAVGVFGANILGNPDLVLIKTDENGDTLWTSHVGDPADRSYGKSVQETEDGGFIVTGHIGMPWDVYLVRTDSEGNTLWTRTFGGAYQECGTSVRQTDDGGYIITGFTGTHATGGVGDVDAFLLKTDASGQVEWTRTYGGPFEEEGYSVEQTTDGGYLVCGLTRSPSGGVWADGFLVKTDSEGDVVWSRTYGGSQEDRLYSARQTSDSGYIAVGETESFGAGGKDVYLIKTDASGDTLWTRTYGGPGIDLGYSVITSSVNGEEAYVVAGATNSFGTGDDDDLYMICADAYGTLIWEWNYDGDERPDEIGRSVAETQDGGLIVAGFAGSYESGGWDWFLMRVETAGGIGLSIRPIDETTLRSGEVLEFTSTITNYTEDVVNGDYWLSLGLPDGSEVIIPDGLLSLPGFTSGQLFPNSSIELENALWLDSRGETGTYSLIGRLGDYPNVVIDEDSFNFEVVE